MSDKKQTFIDPKTGEEIKITRLSYVIDGLIIGLTGGLTLGLIFGLFLAVIGGLVIGLTSGQILGLVEGLIEGLELGLGLGLCGGVFFGLFGGLTNVNEKLFFQLPKKIAYSQHRILKRRLVEKEWEGVPRTALSQAQPPGEPQPTGMSLSQVDSSEGEKPRLTVGIGEESADATEKQSATI